MQQTFKDFGSFKDFVASRTLELINYSRVNPGVAKL
jgi:hypothetical protein